MSSFYHTNEVSLAKIVKRNLDVIATMLNFYDM